MERRRNSYSKRVCGEEMINEGDDEECLRYNFMNKEFQDECKRLELTGYQLRKKYEKEGKSIEKGMYIKG